MNDPTESFTWPTPDWQTASPEDVGLDPAFAERLRTYARVSSPQITSLLVVRHGVLIFEEYFGGSSQESYFSINSVTKSVTSALVGIALHDGLLRSLDETLPELFPELDTSSLEPEKRAITIQHLLTMTSGLAFDRPREFGRFQSDDIVRFALNRPLVQVPGKTFLYDDSSVHLLAIAIARRAGTTLAAYARRTLFDRIGIWQGEQLHRIWEQEGGAQHTLYPAAFWPTNGLPWKVDHHGNQCGEAGLHFTARDMARFGYLYLRHGEWNGQTVVPPEFVELSTSIQNTGGAPGNVPYGFLWWIPVADRHFMASGIGGQIISVLPLRDMVLTYTTATPRNQGGAIIRRFILPLFS